MGVTLQICFWSYIVKDQIVFSEEELADIFPHGLGNFLCFGLLQTASTILDTGEESDSDICLTMYRVARYSWKVRWRKWKDIPYPKQFMKIVGSRHYAVICRFWLICGIYFNEIKCTHFSNLQPLNFIPESGHTLIVCHCAFEAKSEDFCSNTIKLLDIAAYRDRFDSFSSMTVLLYFISLTIYRRVMRI